MPFPLSVHDDAHDAFMTLAPYTSTGEDEACLLDSEPLSYLFGSMFGKKDE